jgi:hypothetical protein
MVPTVALTYSRSRLRPFSRRAGAAPALGEAGRHEASAGPAAAAGGGSAGRHEGSGNENSAREDYSDPIPY